MSKELPEATEHPPMPKVKDLRADYGKYIDITDAQLNPPLPRKEVISIQPGDVIALSFDQKFDFDSWVAVKEAHANMFPNNKTIILENGMSLEVYREQGKPSYLCTLYERECIGDICSVTPNSVRCAHREQVKDGI